MENNKKCVAIFETYNKIDGGEKGEYAHVENRWYCHLNVSSSKLERSFQARADMVGIFFCRTQMSAASSK